MRISTKNARRIRRGIQNADTTLAAIEAGLPPFFAASALDDDLEYRAYLHTLKWHMRQEAKRFLEIRQRLSATHPRYDATPDEETEDD